jgi:hypothetical protein
MTIDNEKVHDMVVLGEVVDTMLFGDDVVRSTMRYPMCRTVW